MVLSLAPNKHGAMGIVEWQVVGLRTRGGVVNVSWTEGTEKGESRNISKLGRVWRERERSS